MLATHRNLQGITYSGISCSDKDIITQARPGSSSVFLRSKFLHNTHSAIHFPGKGVLHAAAAWPNRRHKKRNEVNAAFYAETESYASPLSSSGEGVDFPGSFYELLGISKSVSIVGIKDAYRQLARQYHPDVCPLGLSKEECTRRFIEVQEAYETLSDPRRRAMYDYEMMHPTRVRRGEGLGQRRPWQRKNRPWEAQPAWADLEEQAEVMKGWRSQWKSQVSGLGSRRAPKPGSWAEQMQKRQQQEYQA